MPQKIRWKGEWGTHWTPIFSPPPLKSQVDVVKQKLFMAKRNKKKKERKQKNLKCPSLSKSFIAVVTIEDRMLV